ncbi:MAG: GerMN domain-containing protein [Actinomycetota bacterium]|nr:GerMN domain-containing protein [Actinomycetota bacterium]
MIARPSSTMLGAMLGMTALLGACSIQLDEQPRDVPVEQRLDLDTNDAGAGSSAGETRIFLVAPSESTDRRVLRSVLRDIPDVPQSALEALFQGTNDEEAASNLSTALPSGLELLSATRIGDIITVNVTGELLNVSGEGSILAVAQIVATASGFDGIDAVRLRVDGEPQTWPGADGELLTGPLTVYDYPGLIESSQPAYPGLPSEQR